MSGLQDYATDALTLNGELYFAGPFRFAGAEDHWVATSKVMKWTGAAWATLPAGLNGTAYSLATYGGSLVAGGQAFVSKIGAGSWTQLGGTFSGNVYALAEAGTDLIALGDFTSVGVTTAPTIARWSGSAWSAMGAGFDYASGDFPVTAISYGGDIVVGG